MNKMVEKVALAIAQAAEGYVEGEAVRRDQIGARDWGRYMLQARAAILAMREPASEIVSVGANSLFDYDEDGDGERVSDAWRAMVDEVLRE